YERIQFTADLRDVLQGTNLPDSQRVVLELRYLRGMTYLQISDTMDAPVNTVKSWLHRATDSVRMQLKEMGWSECPIEI
ncbi:MAG TPA: sigma factor-like helix-turn-helix DNA-binding protein, partial [Chthonomonadales bacterium]|nr:sigma factor-like helix-turn-helix DNA-binding protein [Chthonomonadales bacterium]